MYSKIAFPSSSLVFQRFRFSSSVCMRPQNDSMTALSQGSPTVPSEGSMPARRARSVNAQEVNCPDSTGRRNTGLFS